MFQGRPLAVASSMAVTVLRGGSGSRVGTVGPRPAEGLTLYEFEACPFCRKVREALSILDLEVEIRPCPKGGTIYRPEVQNRGGRSLFPYLVDPQAGVEMYESDDIVRHLFDCYGEGKVPRRLSAGAWNTASAVLSGLPRMGRGAFAVPSRRPALPLELWGFEASPRCRLVRERLCVLELPYRLRNVARGSQGRWALRERAPRLGLPLLGDPNTGEENEGLTAILDYLDRTYALPAAS